MDIVDSVSDPSSLLDELDTSNIALIDLLLWCLKQTCLLADPLPWDMGVWDRLIEGIDFRISTDPLPCDTGVWDRLIDETGVFVVNSDWKKRVQGGGVIGRSAWELNVLPAVEMMPASEKGGTFFVIAIVGKHIGWGCFTTTMIARPHLITENNFLFQL